jgi:hypothetical protein
MLLEETLAAEATTMFFIMILTENNDFNVAEKTSLLSD